MLETSFGLVNHRQAIILQVAKLLRKKMTKATPTKGQTAVEQPPLQAQQEAAVRDRNPLQAQQEPGFGAESLWRTGRKLVSWRQGFSAD